MWACVAVAVLQSVVVLNSSSLILGKVSVQLFKMSAEMYTKSLPVNTTIKVWEFGV